MQVQEVVVVTITQAAAFWTWYNTGLQKGSKRSYEAAAEVLGRNPDTIRKWAKEYGWEKAAAEKDQEVLGKIEDKVTEGILDDVSAIIGRQRKLIAKLYDKIEAAIDKMEPTFGQLLELMEYERTLELQPAEGDKKSAGMSLYVLMQHLPPETRSEIQRASGELKRSGRFDMAGAGLGPVSPN